MEQLAERKHPPVAQIERVLGKINEDSPSEVDQIQLNKWSTSVQHLSTQAKLSVNGAVSLGVQQVWLANNGNKAKLKEATANNVACAWAVYAKAMALPPMDAIMAFFGISPDQPEGQLLKAREELGQLNNLVLDKDVEIEHLNAEIQTLRTQLQQLQNQPVAKPAEQAPVTVVKIAPQNGLFPDTADFLVKGIEDLVKPESEPFRQYILPALLDKIENLRIERSDFKS